MDTRILVIEDNAANMELMVYLLQAAGYSTLSAWDGDEGLRVATQQTPDLIVCDIQMPKLNGYEFAQAAKADARLRSVPLIAVTAFAMVGDRQRAEAAGFDGYITKPIEPESFVHDVEAFLPEAGRQQARPRASVPAEAPVEASHSGRTILVVDNDQNNLDLATSLLSYGGYVVLTARDPEAALAIALRAPPDLIISDVCMPGSSGFDFIETVKRDPKLSPIPFIFVTSTSVDERDRRKGLALGATNYLFRPIEAQVLLETVDNCFRELDDN